MISFLLGKFGLGVVGKIGAELRGAYQDKLNAKNTSERIEADRRIAAAEAQKAVHVAEAQHGWGILVRALFGAPLGLFVWKVIVWDKLLGWGVTDDLSPEMWRLLYIVYGFYFLAEIGSAVVKRK